LIFSSLDPETNCFFRFCSALPLLLLSLPKLCVSHSLQLAFSIFSLSLCSCQGAMAVSASASSAAFAVSPLSLSPALRILSNPENDTGFSSAFSDSFLRFLCVTHPALAFGVHRSQLCCFFVIGLPSDDRPGSLLSVPTQSAP